MSRDRPSRAREVEEWFACSQRMNPQGFAIMKAVRGADGKIEDFEWVYRNPAAQRITGDQVTEDLTGRRVLEVMPQTRALGVFDRYAAVVDTGEGHSFEVGYEWEGRPRCYRIDVQRLNDGVAIHYSDLSALRLAEAEQARLAEAERQARDRLVVLAQASEVLSASLDWETTLHNVAGLVLPLLGDFCFFDVVEPGGEVRRIARTHNDPRRQAILEPTRWVRSERTDMNLCALSTGETGFHPFIDDGWMQRIALNEGHLAVLRDLAFCSMVTVPLRYQGRVLGALTMFHADSGRHHTEADVQLSEELARRAAAAVENARLFEEARQAVHKRDDFLSIAAHELKTPLTSLTLLVDNLKRAFAGTAPMDPERMLAHVNRLSRQSWRLNTLVDELLDVSRISTGSFQVEPMEMDLRALLDEVLARFQDAAARDRTPVSLHGPEVLVGSWDQARLDHVFTNLVSNAFRYGERSPVEVRLEDGGDEVRVHVKDGGAGLAPEDHQRVFERFERGSGLRQQSGLGLGLWIAREIVEAHGGRILLQSAPGAGATFTVVLPRRAAVDG